MVSFKSLGNSVKDKTSIRYLILLGGLVVVGAGVFFMAGPGKPVTESDVRAVPTGPATVQGRQVVTPAMDQALAVDDEARRAQAAQTGGSAMPTIRAADSSDMALATSEPEAEVVVPERPPAPVIQRPTITPTAMPSVTRPVAAAPAAVVEDPVVTNLSVALSAIEPPVWAVAKVERFGSPETALPPPANDQQSAAPSTSAGADESAIKLPRPGEILYAELISEANSDSPGPVLAQIVQGELAGAKLIGSFSTQRDALVISFNTISMGTDRNGEVIDEVQSISAYAVDPGKIGTAMATSVDYHLLQNIGITFASAFAQGLGQAIATSGQQVINSTTGTTIVNPSRTTEEQMLIATGTAAGAAGQQLGQIFGNRPVTIKVKSGTPIGVLFLGNGSN